MRNGSQILDAVMITTRSGMRNFAEKYFGEGGIRRDWSSSDSSICLSAFAPRRSILVVLNISGC
jgi:hypothetical protein